MLTYLYDKPKAMEALVALEESWGGTIAERMERNGRLWLAAKQGKTPAEAAAEGSE